MIGFSPLNWLALTGMRFDVHQHIWTEPLLSALAARRETPRVRGSGSHWLLQLEGEPDTTLPSPSPDVGARAALLAADGIDRALVAPSCPVGVESLPRAEAEPLLDAHRATSRRARSRSSPAPCARSG
jgi:6-methylsalicylate decarboxylase